MEVEKSNKVNKKTTINSIHLKLFATLYHTFKLLYCNKHMEITSIHSNVNVEIEINNKINKTTRLNSIYLQIIYIISHLPTITS